MTDHLTQAPGQDAPVVHYPVALSDYRTHPSIDADREASAILTVLTPLLGGEVEGWAVPPSDRHRGEVDARLEMIARQFRTPTTLVWVGHGRSNDHKAFLAVPGVKSGPIDGDLSPEALSELLVSQSRRRGHLEPHPWTLLLVEACGAGRFVELVNSRLQAEGGVRGVALIGVGDPAGEGHTTMAARILAEAAASLDPNHTIIRLSDLLTLIEERLGDGLYGLVGSCRLAGCVINRPQIVLSAPLDVYTELRQALDAQPADAKAHFARKGMGSDFGEMTWTFVGRSRERASIVDHLRHGTGLLAVTGAAGSGKSAVLGNVMLRAQPQLRGILVSAGLLDEDPPSAEESTLCTWTPGSTSAGSPPTRFSTSSSRHPAPTSAKRSPNSSD